MLCLELNDTCPLLYSHTLLSCRGRLNNVIRVLQYTTLEETVAALVVLGLAVGLAAAAVALLCLVALACLVCYLVALATRYLAALATRLAGGHLY